AGGRSQMCLERVAINVNDARIADNEGNQPIDTPVVEDGPVGYWSTLPIKAIVEALRNQGIPASVSQTAGTFVCNHIFYGLMHQIKQMDRDVRGGFIHIPFLPEQAAKHPGQPSMALETIVQGLEYAIVTSINYKQDISVVGGQESSICCICYYNDNKRFTCIVDVHKTKGDAAYGVITCSFHFDDRILFRGCWFD